MCNLFFTIALLVSWVDIKNFSFKLFVIHFFDCLSCAAGSILAVGLVFWSEADKSKFSNLILAQMHWRDRTKCFKVLSELLFSPWIRHILYENIIVNFSIVRFIFWLVFYTNCFCTTIWLRKGTRCTFRINKGYKTIASWLEIFINWDFGWFNLTKFLESLLKTIRIDWLWNLSYEQIVFD